MNAQLKTIIDPKLYNCLLELSKDDVILQQILKRNTDIKEFLNALVAGVVCLVDRQQQNELKLSKLLESNPTIKKMLNSENDTSLLSKSK